MIRRDTYLNKLINKKNNGLIKVVTGIRRCGKSYLLDPIFKNYLIENGVKEDHIIKIELDTEKNVKYHKNCEAFGEYIRSFIKDNDMYYFLLDEIQLVEGFELLLSGLLYLKNVDIYVTGSNSKFLSNDVITEFRGRGDQIHVMPLTFKEFMSVSEKDKYTSYIEYITYGGLPLVLTMKTDEEKIQYLINLFNLTYFKDIVNRYDIKRLDVLDTILNILASSVGSLTNNKKIYDTFISKGEKSLSINTIDSYMNIIENSFLVNKSLRYDIKGRKYINTPSKYYFSDVGLRNAKIKFRQQEETHLMENVIYNELIARGYNIDVGIVETRNYNERKNYEVDFVCNKGFQKIYIQSALTLGDYEKTQQETLSLKNINDSFRKIIIVKDELKPYITEDGIEVINLFDFLLNDSVNI